MEGHYDAVKKKIKEIKDCIPEKLTVEVECEEDDDDTTFLEAVANAISEETGWLVESFNLDDEEDKSAS